MGIVKPPGKVWLKAKPVNVKAALLVMVNLKVPVMPTPPPAAMKVELGT
jgi:hypothetical protein